MKPISVSILICTHNRGEILARTIDSAGAMTLPPGVALELVVIANACTDRTPEVARERCQALPFPARCVEEPIVGLSAARNRAMREAANDILAFIDDDVLLEPAWLEGLCEVLRTTPAEIIAGRVELWWEAVQEPAWISPPLANLLSRTSHGDQPRELEAATMVVGANYAYSRRVYEKTGEYRTDLGRKGASGMGAGEEGEYVRRAMAAGFKLFCAPKMSLRHWVHPKRVDPAYFRKAAIGLGWTNVAMKERFPLPVALRSLVGHAYLFLRHGPAELASLLRGDQRGRYAHRVKRHIGQGGVAAGFRRVLGRPAIPGG